MTTTATRQTTNSTPPRTVELLLNDEEWRLWSDRKIADMCGVAHSFVNKLRPDDLSVHEEQIATPRKVTRNGTTYHMNTSKIGGELPARSASR